ncbi:tyrosine-type recombinase/integrase [Bilophila wadsworthia]|uniref:tyrosine-type recombinase/integrase n=1 Tax=Bilophila wadsworthia TaxID=35833 RepID=UPI00241CC0F6|nr:integrase arm-type DNA-binding domain-containing protein [Bilophila wadsworthia]
MPPRRRYPHALTDTTLRAVKATEKAQKLFDGNGLFLFVSPTDTKSWRLKYRFQGKEKLLTLGTYPQTSLKEARERAADARKQLDGGIDPGEVKKEEQQAADPITLEQVAREWYEKQLPAWSKRHSEDVMERLEKNIFPFLGDRPIAEVNAPELLTVLRRIEARGAIETAHRVRGICSLFFRYAVATSRAERDPAADLKGAITNRIPKPRAAITTPDEVGALMRAIDGFAGTYTVKCALQMCALTFCRPGEVRTAEWTEFDFKENLWRIPGNKMKMRMDHLVPLSRQALDILEELRQLTGSGKYLFPSIRTIERPISDMTLIAGLRRMGFEKDEMSAHGFRAMASTLLNEQGYSADVIEKQLAHSPINKIRGIYNRAEYLPERRKMMQAWADYLVELQESR